jgi:nucleotide-binding universal stress UspA family protein
VKAGLDHAQPVGETGDPADAIIAAAREYEADVIVVGSHDRGWFRRLLNPSVSGAVVRDADVPLLVAR